MSRFPSALFVAALIGSTPAGAQPLNLGRAALPEETRAWDTSVRPDGQGLPVGKGTAQQGEEIFQSQCASCHGEFGQGVDRWPELAGGLGTLKDDRPLKTVGSYWPHLSTVFDYINRAMPFGNPRSLKPDEVYAVTAYILFLNDVVKDESFELNDKNLATIKLPNDAGFVDDDREVSEKAFWNASPCMVNCKSEVQITGHASVLDVTPDPKTAPKVE